MSDIEYANIDHLFAKELLKKENHPLYLFCLELMKVSREGNLFLTKKQVDPSIETVLSFKDSPIVRQGDDYYLKRNYYHEEEIAKSLSHRTSLAGLEREIKIPNVLNEIQKRAFALLNTSPFFLITGGPGSGKSFVAKQIIKAFHERYPNKKILCTAPTGKALTALSGNAENSFTLHKLLGIKEGFDKKVRETPIIADLLIIDECSMISPKLFNQLFSSLLDNTQVILIGDPHQLPPVSGASLFSDLTKIPSIDKVHLTAPMRSDKKAIIDFAEAILTEDENALHNIIVADNEITLKPLTSFKGRSSKSGHIILTPFRKGPYGSLQLNDKIQASKDTSIPILITKNDPITNLNNGDIGFLEDDIATFEEKNIRLPKLMLPPYEKAYALSIHKSQGSEFDHISIILPEEAALFPKELLFTGITRAKKSIQIYGSAETLITLVKNSKKTSSNLHKKIN